jgi:hypothetical protein
MSYDDVPWMRCHTWVKGKEGRKAVPQDRWRENSHRSMIGLTEERYRSHLCSPENVAEHGTVASISQAVARADDERGRLHCVSGMVLYSSSICIRCI